MLAESRAAAQGYDQVLWLDGRERKYIEEVGAMNVFFRLGDTLVTPPLCGTILPGITRDSVLHLLRDWGVEVEERKIGLSEIADAHDAGSLREAFGVGTAAVISPVGELKYDDKSLKVGSGSAGPIANKMFNSITNIQYGKTSDTMGWTLTV